MRASGWRGTLRARTDRAAARECVRGDSPFRTGPLTTLADLEDITSAWVH